MVAPLVLAAGISAASGLLGGALSRRSQRSAAQQEAARQKEFAQHGVRWRVEDAKAAGLHPLYALGGQLPSYSPVLHEDPMGPAVAQAGQSIAGAVAATQTSYERQAAELNLQLIRSQIGESDARKGLADSEAAINRQRLNSTQAFPSIEGVNPDGTPMDFTGEGLGDPYSISGGTKPVSMEEAWEYFNRDNVIPKAPDAYSVTSGDRSVASNINPLWSRFQIDDTHTLYLPGGASSGDAAEVLESISESLPLLYFTYRENVARNGREWTDWFFERYIGGAMKDDVKTLWKWMNPF